MSTFTISIKESNNGCETRKECFRKEADQTFLKTKNTTHDIELSTNKVYKIEIPSECIKTVE